METKYEIFKNIEKCIEYVDIEKCCYYFLYLNKFITLNYSLTINERHKIAKWCIDILFNLKYELSHSFQIILFKTLRKVIMRKDLSFVKFEIDWKPFYELLLSVHFHQNGTILQDNSGIISTHASQLHDTIKLIRHYFKRNSLKEILNELLPYLNPFDIKVYNYMCIKCAYLIINRLCFYKYIIYKYIVFNSSYLFRFIFTNTTTMVQTRIIKL